MTPQMDRYYRWVNTDARTWQLPPAEPTWRRWIIYDPMVIATRGTGRTRAAIEYVASLVDDPEFRVLLVTPHNQCTEHVLFNLGPLIAGGSYVHSVLVAPSGARILGLSLSDMQHGRLDRKAEGYRFNLLLCDCCEPIDGHPLWQRIIAQMPGGRIIIAPGT